MVRLEAFAQLMWNEPKVSPGNPEKCRNPTALGVPLSHDKKVAIFRSCDERRTEKKT